VDRSPSGRDRRNGASLVNAGWIVLAIGVAIAVVMVAKSWLRRHHQGSDLGNVSHQWISEQRLGHGPDSQR
jgi:ABC-type transport system involved in cytochrome c biogenesis permease subunit